MRLFLIKILPTIYESYIYDFSILIPLSSKDSKVRTSTDGGGHA